MAQRPLLPPPGFDELSIDEKVKYVQSLWERIAADESQVSVPDWHKAVLRERSQQLSDDRYNSVSWREAHDHLRIRLRKKGSDQ